MVPVDPFILLSHTKGDSSYFEQSRQSYFALKKLLIVRNKASYMKHEGHAYAYASPIGEITNKSLFKIG